MDVKTGQGGKEDKSVLGEGVLDGWKSVLDGGEWIEGSSVI